MRFEFDAFLKARGIYDHSYSIEDLDQDLATLRRLETKGLLRRATVVISTALAQLENRRHSPAT